MERNEKFLAKLAEIRKEYEEKLSPKELVKSRLRWEDWETLRKEAVSFAQGEIRRRKWRAGRGGILPEGYDAEAVANEVIGQILQGKSRLVIGFTRETVLKELKRLIGQRVRLLQRLKETAAVRSEWDGVNDGEEESVLERMAAESEAVDETVCRHEEELWRRAVIADFGKLLEREPELRAIFGCLSAGLSESKEIAESLGIKEAEVVKGRKKLARRAGMFSRLPQTVRHAG